MEQKVNKFATCRKWVEKIYIAPFCLYSIVRVDFESLKRGVTKKLFSINDFSYFKGETH